MDLFPDGPSQLPHAFYLVFEGSRARHVCRAQLIHRSEEGRLLLLTTAPPHDRVEQIELRAFYRSQRGSVPVHFYTTKFQFVSDAAYQVGWGSSSGSGTIESRRHSLEVGLQVEGDKAYLRPTVRRWRLP